MSTGTVIKGLVRFEAAVLPFEEATLHVYLENVSVVDASAIVVETFERNEVRFPEGIARDLSFEIPFRHPDARERYGIRAHIDINGDGAVSPGDFVSMESYPVATLGYPTQISVLVREVR